MLNAIHTFFIEVQSFEDVLFKTAAILSRPQYVKTYSYFPIQINDVMMSAMASRITSLTVVCSIVYSGTDQRKHQSSASLAFVWVNHRDRWIPRTKGQLRGKCFHLMTSSCVKFWRNAADRSKIEQRFRIGSLRMKDDVRWKEHLPTLAATLITWPGAIYKIYPGF